MSLQMAEKGTDAWMRPHEKELEGFGKEVALQGFVGIHIQPLLLNHFWWQQAPTKDQS